MGAPRVLYADSTAGGLPATHSCCPAGHSGSRCAHRERYRYVSEHVYGMVMHYLFLSG